jgi:hypothetical protein
MSGKMWFKLSILIFTLLLAGCTSPWAAKANSASSSSEPVESLAFLLNPPTSTVQPSNSQIPPGTPDPCAPENFLGEIKKINNPVLQFEQIVFIARFTPSAELIRPILELQNILWQAQIQEAPTCLAELKVRRDEYLGSVISYMVHFMGGIKPEILDTEMQTSASLRQAYEVELALITGVNTPTPLPTTTATSSEPPETTPGTPAVLESPRPGPSPAAPTVTKAVPSVSPTLNPPPAPTSTPESRGSIDTKTIPVTGGQVGEIIMTNTTGHNLFLHATPSLTSQTVYILAPDAEIPISGRMDDGIWLMAEYKPGSFGWVYFNINAKFSIPVPGIPVVTPQP